MSNRLHSKELAEIYRQRFGGRAAQRQTLWSTLCEHFFQQYIGSRDVVLDLAAGYCEFINNIRCGQKHAVDLNADTRDHASPDVIVHIASSDRLPEELHGTVDLVFVSNFFEHLDDKHQFLDTLREIAKVLKPGGRLLILQPNLRLTKEAYWDFVDHSLPITDKSLREALELTGFSIEEQKIRFLPYSTEGALPIHPLLIRLYLKIPPVQWLLGKQTFVLARH